MGINKHLVNMEMHMKMLLHRLHFTQIRSVIFQTIFPGLCTSRLKTCLLQNI